MFLHDRLRECREKSSLTIEDTLYALDKIGMRISRPTLINWEKGITSPDASDLAVLASYFKKPAQYFFEPLSIGKC